MTLATHKLYLEAIALGFIVKIAEVTLFSDWNYDIKLINLEKYNYCIDKPKKYDNSEFN